MDLDRETLMHIDNAISSIYKKYGRRINQVRMGKLTPMMNTLLSRRSTREAEIRKVFRIPNDFAQVYAMNNKNRGLPQGVGVTVTAFTTYASSGKQQDDRLIYFRNNPPAYGTVVHELFHWLCHQDFFEGFHGSQVVKVGRLDEGITEFLTRTIVTRQRGGHYDEECGEASALWKSDNEKILSSYFSGSELEALKTWCRGMRRKAGDYSRVRP